MNLQKIKDWVEANISEAISKGDFTNINNWQIIIELIEREQDGDER